MGAITVSPPCANRHVVANGTTPSELIEVDDAFARLEDPTKRTESIQFIAKARVQGSEPIRNRVFDNLRELKDQETYKEIVISARIMNARMSENLLRTAGNSASRL